MAVEFAERLAKLPPYPAAAGYATGREIAALASNECPLGPIAAVRDAIVDNAGMLNRYPDPSNRELRAALANRFDFPPEMIAVGNGSSDLLIAAGLALLEPGAEVAYGWPSFSLYPHLATLAGARAVAVALTADHVFDLTSIEREITVATRLVIICNPNNPTSTAVGIEELTDFVARLPGSVCIIVDEAYIEYALTHDPDESIDLVRRHPNVVLMRSFSKIYGLAGLRVGYALCGSREFAQALDRIRQPFSVSQLAQTAAIESLRHQDEVARRMEQNLADRMVLEEQIKRLGLRVADSQTNFLWVAIDPEYEEQICRDLQRSGVLVRPGRTLGEAGFIRVTVGTAGENERLLAQMQRFL